MDEEGYAARLGLIRARFENRLGETIRETHQSLERLVGGDSGTAEEVAKVYRRFHSVCGVSGTLGFERTGTAARTLDAILKAAFREGRSLTAAEASEIGRGLQELMRIARAEAAEGAVS